MTTKAVKKHIGHSKITAAAEKRLTSYEAVRERIYVNLRVLHHKEARALHGLDERRVGRVLLRHEAYEENGRRAAELLRVEARSKRQNVRAERRNECGRRPRRQSE